MCFVATAAPCRVCAPVADCVVLVPMLGRADMVPALVESLQVSTDRARPLFIVTAGDAEVIDAVRLYDSVTVAPRTKGDYAAKINEGYRQSTEPLIFLGAIDIRFRRGWLEACERRVKAGAHVVGTNDRCNRRTATGDLSTHTLVTRAYADRGTIDGPGILHEGYVHECCDDELVQTAKFRGVYAHAHDAVVEHHHWMNGKRPRDQVDADYEARMWAGRRLLARRSRLWA